MPHDAFIFLSGAVVGNFFTIAIVIAAAAFGTALAGRVRTPKSMKPKAARPATSVPSPAQAPTPALPPPSDQQVAAALKALKFTNAEIETALSRIPATGTVPERLRLALRALQPQVVSS